MSSHLICTGCHHTFTRSPAAALSATTALRKLSQGHPARLHLLDIARRAGIRQLDRCPDCGAALADTAQVRSALDIGREMLAVRG